MADRPLVLIVEDEPIIRMVAALTAEAEGFQVMQASNADAAVALLEHRWQDVSVMFTDIRMPGSMDGLELAITVRRCWPSIGIIITSAYFVVEDRPLPPRCHFLDKPYADIQRVRALHDLTA